MQNKAGEKPKLWGLPVGAENRTKPLGSNLPLFEKDVIKWQEIEK